MERWSLTFHMWRVTASLQIFKEKVISFRWSRGKMRRRLANKFLIISAGGGKQTTKEKF